MLLAPQTLIVIEWKGPVHTRYGRAVTLQPVELDTLLAKAPEGTPPLRVVVVREDAVVIHAPDGKVYDTLRYAMDDDRSTYDCE